MTGFWLPASMLFRRELLRFWRERARVAGFVGTPFLFWMVVGSGYSNFGKFLPGALLLTVMFSAIFSAMTLIEDRREGFLLSALASPAPRSAIVLGKVAGSALIAAIQGLIFFLLASLGGTLYGPVSWPALIGLIVLSSLGFTAAGFLIAWRINSAQGFHAMINLIFMPLWMISGSLFSFNDANRWIGWLMRFNPLTYAVQAMAKAMGFVSEAPVQVSEIAAAVVAITVGILLVAATLEVRRPSERSLP
jgi:ABC-2 type transport system permease protein